jgi:hypothetical protein
MSEPYFDALIVVIDRDFEGPSYWLLILPMLEGRFPVEIQEGVVPRTDSDHFGFCVRQHCYVVPEPRYPWNRYAGYFRPLK